ncbi:MAG: T9SS type A sorting domain-containing protein [Bacteroidota bacterium]
MKTKLQLLSFFALTAFFMQAQPVTVNLSLDPSYTNEVYYKLSTQTATTFPSSSWDIAFLRVSNFDLGVRVNDGDWGIEVYEVSTNPADYATVDVSNESSWTQLYNDDTNWSNGAFMQTSLSGPLAFGFGNYNPGNNTVQGEVVFVLKYQDGTFRKFFIETYLGAYTFKYSTWTGTEWTADTTETVSNSSNPNNRFNYYSLENQTEVVAEPSATDWDFVFRRYSTFLDPPGQWYTVTGALHNPNVQVAQNEEMGGMPADPQLTFSDDINTIGDDWKTFVGTGFSVDSNQAYYVKYSDDTIYRLYFTEFSGTSSGDLEFVLEDVSATLNVQNLENGASFGIYPNPSQDKIINIVYDNELANNSSVELFDITGKRVKQIDLNSNVGFFNKQINLTDLNSGVYLFKFSSGNFSETKKIILD